VEDVHVHEEDVPVEDVLIDDIPVEDVLEEDVFHDDVCKENSKSSLVAEIEKIRRFISAANTLDYKVPQAPSSMEEKAEATSGVFWADVAIIDGNDEVESGSKHHRKHGLTSRNSLDRKGKSWLQENLDSSI